MTDPYAFRDPSLRPSPAKVTWWPEVKTFRCHDEDFRDEDFVILVTFDWTESQEHSGYEVSNVNARAVGVSEQPGCVEEMAKDYIRYEFFQGDKVTFL